MKEILVTGAAGYMGRHIVSRLLDCGEKVTVVSVGDMDAIDIRATKMEKDIFLLSEKELDLISKYDVCIHLAWKDGFIHNSHEHIKKLADHDFFLKSLIDRNIKQLVVLGTMHEVGYWEGAINEETPCNPISMYGIAKNALRQSLLLYSKNKNTIMQWIRAYYIYGDDRRNNSIFAKLLKADDEGQEKFPFTSGKNKYDFLHIKELADQIVSVSCQNKIDGIINCCSGTAVTLSEQVENFIKDNKLRIQLQYGAYPDRDYDSPAVWGENTKIKKVLDAIVK